MLLRIVLKQMSNPEGSSDGSKPVTMERDPHNYRKVGYSMIVIAVSLTLIGLVVWAIGDNWHFSTDIMANQEIESMTPKHGYAIVFYDAAQPIGAKLKQLDSSSTIDDAKAKLQQYSTQYNSNSGMAIVFNETLSANQLLVKNTIDKITKNQAAIAEAQKEKAEKAMKAAAVNTTATQNVTKAVSVQNATKTIAAQNVTKTTSMQNATTPTLVSTLPAQNINKSSLPGQSIPSFKIVSVESMTNKTNFTLTNTHATPVTSQVSNSTQTKSTNSTQITQSK